jgi:hypothetical protein
VRDGIAAKMASGSAPGSDGDGRLRRHSGGLCRFGLSTGCCPQYRTLIRHAAASGTIFAATIGMHPTPAVGRLVSAAGFPLSATPHLQGAIATTVHLTTVTSATNKNLSTTMGAKKKSRIEAFFAARYTRTVLR